MLAAIEPLREWEVRMRRSLHSISVIAMSCLLVLGALPSLALAADPSASGGKGPRVGGPYRAGATTKPLKAIAKDHPASHGTARTVQPEGLGRGTTSSSPSVVTPDGAAQTDATPGDAPQELTAPLVSFAGQTSPFTPPDPNGDVGPNHYVQMVNSQIQIWNKQGHLARRAPPTSTCSGRTARRPAPGSACAATRTPATQSSSTTSRSTGG